MVSDEELAAIISEHLPSPYALDVVWRETDKGVVLDLVGVSEDVRTQWLELIAAVRSAFDPSP